MVQGKNGHGAVLGAVHVFYTQGGIDVYSDIVLGKAYRLTASIIPHRAEKSSYP